MVPSWLRLFGNWSLPSTLERPLQVREMNTPIIGHELLTRIEVIYSLHTHKKSWPVKASNWPGSPRSRGNFDPSIPTSINISRSRYIPSPTDVPTLLAYGPNGGDVRWGFKVFEAPAEWTRLQGFYNPDLLDPGSTIASQTTPSPLEKSFHDLCRDFIDCLYTDLVYILSKNSFPPSEIAYHVFFTMPESTSKPSINAMRSIIQETGFAKHSFYVGRTDWDAVAANIFVNTISKEPERFLEFAEPGKHFLVNSPGFHIDDIETDKYVDM